MAIKYNGAFQISERYSTYLCVSSQREKVLINIRGVEFVTNYFHA